jgi:predicted nucleotidyltransferase
MDMSDRKAIADFLEVTKRLSIPTLAIGASARQLVFDEPHRLPTRRTTLDWDFATKVASWQEFQTLQTALSRDFQVQAAHRLEHKRFGTLVDLVPFGGVAKNEIIYFPKSDVKLSVLGFDTALRYAEQISLDEQTLTVTSLPWLVGLKLFAWADRQAYKDLDDLAFMLQYASEVVGEQIYEATVPDELPFEARGAFVLGFELGQQALAQERQRLEAILQALLQPPEYLVLSRLASRSLTEREQRSFMEVTVRRFEALELGLRLTSS